MNRVTPVVDPAVGIEFLSRWFEFTPEDQWVSVFGVHAGTGERSVAWARVGELESLEQHIQRLGATGDLWFGAATRREKLDHRRGGVGDCSYLPGMFADIDVEGPGHKLPGLPPTMDAAVALVKHCPIEPHAVVRTGYGLQPWWRFAEAIPADEAKPLLARCLATWEAAAGGYHVDNVFSLDRVLRLPGTYNWKGPEPVLVRYGNKWGVGHPSSWDDWLLPPAPPSEPKERAFTAHLAGSRFNEANTVAMVLRSCGLTSVRTDPNGDEHFHHPDAGNDVSVTVYAEDDHGTCWSETMQAKYGIPVRRPMDPFGWWTWLTKGGDFSLANTVLVVNGVPNLARSTGDGTGALTAPRRPPTLAELLTHDDEDYDWLVPGLIERGDRVVLTGKEGEGKSTLLRHMGITAAAGFHPFTLEPIRPLRVLDIDCENSVRQLRREFIKALDPLLPDVGDLLERFFVEVHTEGLALDLTRDPGGDRAWLEATIAGCDPDVVIVGPIYKIIQGDANDEEPNRELVKFLDRLRVRYGFAILLEAHPPHDAKRPYGWSGWKRWPEFGLHLDAGGELARWRGDRDARAWPERLAKGGAGGWLWTAGGAQEPSPDTRELQIVDAELELLRAMRRAAKPLSKPEVLERVSRRKSMTLVALNRLRDQGAFIVTREDRPRANGRPYPIELFQIDPSGPFAADQ